MGSEDPDRGASRAGGATCPEFVVLVVLALVLVTLSAPVAGVVSAAGGAATATGGTTSDGDTQRTGAPLTECFVGEGYPLSIGNGSATIDAAVHASVLTDPAAGDEFGVELAGSLDGDPLVTVAAGVRFDAPGLIANGMNPFAAFDLLYTYELRLPMFDGIIDDSEFREDRPPVGSAAGTVPC